MITYPIHEDTTEIILDSGDVLLAFESAEDGVWVGPFDTRGDAIEFAARAEEAIAQLKNEATQGGS